MAGFGRSSRPGKRSSSSSPYFSTATMLVFVAFCVLAVWMISSSSYVPSSSSTNTAIRARASVSTSYSKPSPSLLLKDAGDGAEEEEVEATEEMLPAPVVSETAVDVGGDGDAGQVDRDKEDNAEAQGEDGAGDGDNQREEPQQQQQQQQQRGQASEEESRQEHTEEEGTERSRETGLEQEEQGNDGNQELQSHAVDGDGREELQQQEEEGQMETHEHHNDGDNDDHQQQLPETENVGVDDQQLQQTQESQQGGSNEGQLQSHQEQEDVEGDQNQMQQTIEAGGGDEQEQTLQQQEDKEEMSDENRAVGSLQETEEGFTVSGAETPPDEPNGGDSLPVDAQPEVSTDGKEKEMAWSTQADQSQNEKERREGSHPHAEGGSGSEIGDIHGYKWEPCNVTAGQDYIPCLDNEEALRHLHRTKHYEHRERHCPEEPPTCLVPLPKGYKHSIEWPKSREGIWYNNVPHTKLAMVKGHQNWVKVAGEYLTFPGGGTQFVHGALHYIDFIQKSVRHIAWGKHTRVILDVGCGVASFGGYLFEKGVLTMSFAPKDEHEAQVQLALERGIPAISAVMGSQRLPFPSRVYDLVHCARCRVPWHVEGGALLLELNRVLRPGGYFVWSATPVYQKLKEDVEIWNEMTSLTRSMCWDLITIRKDRLNSVAAAIYRKPTSNECYDNRKHHIPPVCQDEDDPDIAWYVPLHSCMHRIPTDASERGSHWPEEWPRRLRLPPYWLNSSQVGVYGKTFPDDFTADYEHWKRVVSKSYLHGLGIDWPKARNVMDMRAVYGGFAAALKDLKIWVMNVVNVEDSPDTLPIIFERGLFGIYHDWCESFSTYPRTYDVLHADLLFSRLKKRCNVVPVVVEVDRILRPGGKLVVRDEPNIVSEIENILRSLHWEVHLTFSKGQQGILCAEKSDWRPEIFFGSS